MRNKNHTPIRPKRSVKPKTRNDTIEWFQEEELPKKICYLNGEMLPYFHGNYECSICEGEGMRGRHQAFIFCDKFSIS